MSATQAITPMNKFYLLVFLIIPFGVQATPTVLRLNCAMYKIDPDEPARAFTQGTFSGQCIDTSSVRPPTVINENSHFMYVTNFYHDKKFWRATIPKHSVETVLFQIVPFDSEVPLIQAAHTQIRFILAPGRTISLVSPITGERAHVTDVIVSSTYTSSVNVEYSVLKSRGGSFGIVTRFMSSIARAHEEIEKDKSVVRQFALELSRSQKDNLLFLALRRASSANYNDVYDLLERNCATVTFDTLDQLKPPPPGIPPMRGSLWNFQDEFIEPSLEALRKRHLIHRYSETAPMNDEMKF